MVSSVVVVDPLRASIVPSRDLHHQGKGYTIVVVQYCKLYPFEKLCTCYRV